MTASPTGAVVIGASAGGLEALTAILPALPADFCLPVLVVVHLRAGVNNLMPELLSQSCQMQVREVEDKEPICPGVVYFAPPDYHLLVERDHRLSLSIEEPVHYSRPSVDVLFETAADAYGGATIGIVLTGANNDGAAGLKTICAAGGIALVQRPQEASSPEMPRAAIEACPMAQVMTLREIANYLIEVGTPV